MIHKARRWRKVLGGGMRQAGFIAAAGIVALRENIDRLQDDHNNARKLFEGLRDINELNLTDDSLQTNMVFLDCGKSVAEGLAQKLGEKGIILTPAAKVRLVVHKDVSARDVGRVAKLCREYFNKA